MKKQSRVVPTIHHCCVKRIAQAAAVVLVTCSTIVGADNCAGGMDASGNECSDAQSARSLTNAAPRPSKSSRIVFAKRAETLAQTRLAEAKLRQGDATAAVTIAEANLVAARKAVADAQYAPRH